MKRSIKFQAGGASLIALLAAAPAMAQDDVEILNQWNYDEVYAEGWSVENMLDDADVIDATGEDVGNVENVIFSNDGELISLIVEVGGFWDIGDTHVNVPISEIGPGSTVGEIRVPFDEDTVDEYSAWGDGAWMDEEVITEGAAEEAQVVDDDLVGGPGVFRANELIGDYSYLTDNTRYGYVNDIIVQDGQIAAIVVDAAAYGRRGFYAYPYGPGWTGRYGAPGYGWRQDMPYGPEEVDAIEDFDYDRLQTDAVVVR